MAETGSGNPGGLGPLAPYVRNVVMDDPLMKRVPFNHMDIGANSVSMPEGTMIGDRPPGIEHVGTGVKKAG
jgi:hypothetical protein